MLKLRALFVALLFLSACSGGSDVDDGTASLELSKSSFAVAADSLGRATFQFSIPPGKISFHLSGSSSSGTLRLISLVGPSGQQLIEASSEVAPQADANPSPNRGTNFPFINPVTQSGTYQATYLVSGGAPGATVSVDVYSKSDADLQNGNLKINILLIGPVVGQASLRSSLEDAFEIFKEIFARAGISLDPVWYEFQGSDTIPNPAQGNPIFTQLANATRPEAVNIVIASRVTGLRAPDSRFAVVGIAPGTITSTNQSAIALSILQLSGGDGDLDTDEQTSNDIHDNETRLTAEEMARLTARYLGLENIVDIRGNVVVGTDSLTDTESCLTEEDCREQNLVRSNVMFPRILRILGDSRRYYAREAITDQQRAVLNLHPLVD